MGSPKCAGKPLVAGPLLDPPGGGEAPRLGWHGSGRSGQVHYYLLPSSFMYLYSIHLGLKVVPLCEHVLYGLSAANIGTWSLRASCQAKLFQLVASSCCACFVLNADLEDYGYGNRHAPP